VGCRRGAKGEGLEGGRVKRIPSLRGKCGELEHTKQSTDLRIKQTTTAAGFHKCTLNDRLEGVVKGAAERWRGSERCRGGGERGRY
jgi:hypothetical protein